MSSSAPHAARAGDDAWPAPDAGDDSSISAGRDSARSVNGHTPGERQRQTERSRLMRQRLMEATIETLLEHGWTGASTTEITRRAGVSRGAQVHHFPTKADLVVAALSHMGEARREELRAAAPSLDHDDDDRTYEILRTLAAMFTGPFFVVALELWVAARTDPTLHDTVTAMERVLGRETHRLAVDLLGVDESASGVRELLQATLDLLRGLALANLLTDDTRRREVVLRQWAHTLDATLAKTSPAATAPGAHS